MKRLLNTAVSCSLPIITVALLLAVSAPPLAASAEVSSRGTARRRTRVLKRTWHGLPASTPPQTEVVPLAPLPPAPADLHSLDLPDEPMQTAAEAGQDAQPAVVRQAKAETEQAFTEADSPEPNRLERERVRTREELERLRHDPDARRSFYDDLRRTVEVIRAGARNEDSPESSTEPPQPEAQNASAGHPKPHSSASQSPWVDAQQSLGTGPPRGPRYIPARTSLDTRQKDHYQQ